MKLIMMGYSSCLYLYVKMIIIKRSEDYDIFIFIITIDVSLHSY
jgi:hypothetical protein